MKQGLTVKEVKDALRAACDAAGSQRAWARQHGLSDSHVSEMLTGIRPPQTSICEVLGIDVVVKYFKKDHHND